MRKMQVRSVAGSQCELACRLQHDKIKCAGRMTSRPAKSSHRDNYAA
ncbi:hypothetical protein ACVMB0_007652 [Bradyrhizobium sp. USDA 4451]